MAVAIFLNNSGAHEYLIYYQVQISSSLNDHIVPRNSDVDCGWLMNSEHGVQSLLNTCLFGVRFKIPKPCLVAWKDLAPVL